MNIEIYYDGTNISDNSGDEIKGFTTNISFLKAAGITNYETFIKESLQYSKGRPISFQLFDDENEQIKSTANTISSYGDSIFVKVPIIKTTEESNAPVIQELHEQHVKINVTAIFTREQIDSISTIFNDSTNVIVSIFGGRINDCGLNCSEVVRHARDTFSDKPNVKILWAACRTVYNIIEAENQGAHIVTVPESVLKRMSRMGENPHEASVQTVKQFREDGVTGKLDLR